MNKAAYPLIIPLITSILHGAEITPKNIPNAQPMESEELYPVMKKGYSPDHLSPPIQHHTPDKCPNVNAIDINTKSLANAIFENISGVNDEEYSVLKTSESYEINNENPRKRGIIPPTNTPDEFPITLEKRDKMHTPPQIFEDFEGSEEIVTPPHEKISGDN